MRGAAGRRLALLLPIVLLLLAHQLYFARRLGFDVVDDAYISFRYAQNLAASHGVVFNVGERVEGYTNFLWTVILAVAGRVGASMPVAALVGGMVIGMATLLLVFFCGARERLAVGAVAGLLLAADGSFALWSVGGLEAELFGFLLLAAAIAFRREMERGGFPWSGPLFALAAMTRPEGLLIFTITVAFQGMRRLLMGWQPIGKADAGRIALFAGMYIPYFVWRFTYYGFFLPNTFYAKVGGAGSLSDRVDRGFDYISTFMGMHLGWAILALVAVAFLSSKGRVWLLYLLLIVAAFFAYSVYVGGDWSPGRFLVPALPFFYLLIAEGLATLYLGAMRLRPTMAAPWASDAVAIVALGLLAYGIFNASGKQGEERLFMQRFNARAVGEARVAAGKWLRQNAPPDSLIAVDAAGMVPYYSGLRAIDMFGLNDVYTAHMDVKSLGKGVAGHEKMDLSYVLARRPDYVVIYGRLLDGFPEKYERLDMGWASKPWFGDYVTIYRRKQ